jgi:hypothetical protein
MRTCKVDVKEEGRPGKREKREEETRREEKSYVPLYFCLEAPKIE